MERMTIKQLMERVNLSYNGAFGLMRRMKAQGLAQEVGSIKSKSSVTKIYGMKVSPEEYLSNERQQRATIPLPVSFFNNPFNLREARDARYQSN